MTTETKLRERAGFMLDAGHNDDANLDIEAADLTAHIRRETIEKCAELCDAAALHYASLQSGAKEKRKPKEARDFESMRIAAVGLGLELRRKAGAAS